MDVDRSVVLGQTSPQSSAQGKWLEGSFGWSLSASDMMNIWAHIDYSLTPEQQFLDVVVLIQNSRVGSERGCWGVGALEKFGELRNC